MYFNKKKKRTKQRTSKRKNINSKPIYSDTTLPKYLKKRLVSAVKKSKLVGDIPRSAQNTIPYEHMGKDGVCRVQGNYFTKTIEFFDINYQLAQNEDKQAIFENYCDFLNYFDSGIKFQLTFVNRYGNTEEMEQVTTIPLTGDEFDSVRKEYSDMLKNQLTKGNNGLMKRKYITFGIEANSRQVAKTRLERIELDIINNFKAMSVQAKPLNGYERLMLLFQTLRPDSQDLFRFNWDLLAGTGLSSKDFIVPVSFTFDKGGKTFRTGDKLGNVSFLQILAPELTDRMLADFLNLEHSQLINLHVQSIDQSEAIKLVKGKLSDIDKMKIDLQKKANNTGYSMDILPADLKTYGQEAENLLTDLQSRNERMFLVTVAISTFADNKRQLDDNVFQAAGIALKYNCKLLPLDYMQEQGFLSSLPIGSNKIPIERGLTTSALAIFVPFTTRELFQSGEALYYGLNALSNNMIMCDRKTLKNPKGLYHKGTGIIPKTQAGRVFAAHTDRRGKGETAQHITVVYHQKPNMKRGPILCRNRHQPRRRNAIVSRCA